MSAFNRRIYARVPAAWLEHLETAARAFDCTVSEYLREALAEALVNDGFAPKDPTSDSQTIGELQDVVDGQREWYLISDANILTGPRRSAEKPNDAAIGTWLPVVNADSEPFDRRRHWRLTPEMRVEPDRVVRFYPVVRKSLDHV
jgi:hypothetical protein